jgi:hypothetical protein
MFIADRRGISDAAIAGLGFEDGFGRPVSVLGLQDLVEEFAPTLWFNAGENYSAPISVQQFLAGATLRDASDAAFSSPLSAVPDAGSYLDLSGESIGAFQVPSGEPTVYASVVPDLSSTRLAINYWFHFPYNDWRNHQDNPIWGNNHEGDWEGITIFFERDSATSPFRPIEVGYAQHKRLDLTVTILVRGGETVAWSQAVVNSSRSPNVFVALGSHASYFNPGVTTVGGAGFVTGLDEHRGNDLANRLVPGAYTVAFIDRAPELVESTNGWALFPGSWGQPGLPGGELILRFRSLRDSAVLPTRQGADGPRGPVFQDGGFWPGLRWFDPWTWSELIGDSDGAGTMSTPLQNGLHEAVVVLTQHPSSRADGFTRVSWVSSIDISMHRGSPLAIGEEQKPISAVPLTMRHNPNENKESRRTGDTPLYPRHERGRALRPTLEERPSILRSDRSPIEMFEADVQLLDMVLSELGLSHAGA